jgi:hypothetical protein
MSRSIPSDMTIPMSTLSGRYQKTLPHEHQKKVVEAITIIIVAVTSAATSEDAHQATTQTGEE